MAVIDIWGRRGALPSPRPARPQLERARVRIAVGPQWRRETQSKSGTRAGQHPAAREARHHRLDLDTASYPVHLARRGPGGGGYGLSRYGPITVPARTQRSSPARAGRRWIMMGGAELGARPLARPSAHTATPRQHSSACPHSAPGGGGNRAADRPSRLERTGPQRRSHQVV
jgi:hypothetical protein